MGYKKVILYGHVAQWITRRSTEPKIAGSTPAMVKHFLPVLEKNFLMIFDGKVFYKVFPHKILIEMTPRNQFLTL
jgi:hypothetical protein